MYQNYVQLTSTINIVPIYNGLLLLDRINYNIDIRQKSDDMINNIISPYNTSI